MGVDVGEVVGAGVGVAVGSGVGWLVGVPVGAREGCMPYVGAHIQAYSHHN